MLYQNKSFSSIRGWGFDFNNHPSTLQLSKFGIQYTLMPSQTKPILEPKYGHGNGLPAQKSKQGHPHGPCGDPHAMQRGRSSQTPAAKRTDSERIQDRWKASKITPKLCRTNNTGTNSTKTDSGKHTQLGDQVFPRKKLQVSFRACFLALSGFQLVVQKVLVYFCF